MTKFNLNDLRADVADHSDWFIYGFGDHDAMIDFIIEALIGSDCYDLMLEFPYAKIKFNKFGHALLMFHDFTK